ITLPRLVPATGGRTGRLPIARHALLNSILSPLASTARRRSMLNCVTTVPNRVSILCFSYQCSLGSCNFLGCGSFSRKTVRAMNESVTQIKDTTGNPAPLGLLGFGMTTVLLNLHNAGFYELNSMILAMGICYGGLAQIVAGIMEWRKGNTFATTAFLSYGLFWLS